MDSYKLERFSDLCSFRLEAEGRRCEVPPEGGNYTEAKKALDLLKSLTVAVRLPVNTTAVR
jgi:hypothetical protein